MKCNRIILFILAFVLCAASVGCYIGATTYAEGEEYEYGEYIFGKDSDYSYNIEKTQIQGSRNIVEKGGRWALERGPGNLYVYIRMPDSFSNPEGTPVHITVDYYDDGDGCFTLAYDGPENRNYPTHTHTNAQDVVFMEGTKTWKQHDFYLENMSFVHNYTSGYDFRLSLWADGMTTSKDKVYFGGIRVEKRADPVAMFRPTSEFTGNIFGEEDSRIIEFETRNHTDSVQTGKMDYVVKDYYGNTVLEKTVDGIRIEPQSKAMLPADLSEVEKYGVYKVTATASLSWQENGKTKSATASRTGDYAFINKPDKKNPRMNVGTHWSWFTQKEIADTVGYLGVGGIRDELMWNEVELTKGDLKIPALGADYIKYLEEQDLDFYLALDYGNKYYNTDEQNAIVGSLQHAPPDTPEGMEGWSNYVDFMSGQNSGIFGEFEVWNEYNIGNFNKTNASPAVYAELAKRSYEAVKKNNPNAKVFTGGFAGADEVYLESILKEGVYDYSDGFSCHPYDWSGHFRNQYFIDRLNTFNNKIMEYGERKPLYLTEFGLTDSEDGAVGVSTMEKAGGILQFYSMMVGDDLAEKWFYYEMVGRGQKTEREHNWGLVQDMDGEPYAPTPAYVVMAGMNSFMVDAQPLGSAVTEDTYARAYNFRSRKGDNLAVAWSEYGTRNMTLDLGVDAVELYDMYTNHIGTLHSTDGKYTLTADYEPVYLRGNFSKFELAESSDVEMSVVSASTPANYTMELPVSDTQGRNLTIKTDVSEGGFLPVEDVQLSDGNGVVPLKSATGAMGEYKVNFNVYDGDRMISRFSSRITVGKAIEAEITEIKQVNDVDAERWEALVKISNVSYNSVITGVCELVDDDLAENKQRVPFFDLRPNQSVTLHMNMPIVNDYRSEDVICKIVLDSGDEYTAIGRTDYAQAKYAYQKPVIDGTIDKNEWNGRWCLSDQRDRFYVLQSGYAWKGPYDLSYKINVMWDEEYLYLAADVSDNMFYNPLTASMWNADSIQFAIEDGVYQGEYFLDPNGKNSKFTEIGIAKMATGNTITRYKAFNPDLKTGINLDSENCKLEVGIHSGNTQYELAIPWTELFGEGYVPDENKIYGFSSLANDSDGAGRLGYMYDYGGIGDAKDANKFGRLHLVR